VQVTLADMTLGAYTSGGLKAVPNMSGFYDFCPPDAALATGASSVAFLLYPATTTVTMAPVPIEVQLTQADLDDATDFGLTNLDAAVSTRLPTASYVAPDNTSTSAIKAKTDQMTFTSNDLNVTLDGEQVTVGGYAAGQAPLQPAVSGRTLDVDASGAVALQSGGVQVSSLTNDALNEIRNKFLIVGASLNGPTVGARTVNLGGSNTANNDALVGCTLAHFTAGGSLIQLRTIVAYDLATDTVTVDEDWLVNPADTDIIRVYEHGNAKPGSVWLHVVDGVRTAKQLIRGFVAALLGKSSGHSSTGASLPKYRNVADTKDVISASTDASGNRTSVTLDLD
jgi:hypothetical protein